MAKKKSDIVPGGVTEYIAACPKDIQSVLKNVQTAIQSAVPGAVQTMSYFKMPGFFYDGGYGYNGMFVWFSYKKPYVRLHVLPEAVKEYKKELAGYTTTAAIVSFPENEKIPVTLIKKLTKASLKVMKAKAK